jgi:hypothetical protein
MVDEEVAAKSNGRCWYCGEHRWENCVPTNDHQRPVCRGGRDMSYNLVLACDKCNSQKGHMTVGEFRDVLAGERYAYLLALGLSNPPIPRVVFYGEQCTPGPLRFCREQEAELKRLEPRPADPPEVRRAKANRRKRLRQKFRRFAYWHGGQANANQQVQRDK